MSNQEPKRVNIQFSIELDELPAEVSRLLEKSSEYVNDGSKLYNNISRNGNNLTSETWEEIDNIRICLTKADQVLDDLQKIIGGYMKMKSEIVQPQATTPTQEEEPPPSPFMQNHPDSANTQGNTPFAKSPVAGMPQGMDMNQMQNQMMGMISNMQQNMPDAPNMSEEERQAAEVLKNRLSNMMNSQNENANKTTS
tara:strand:+ start:830 stop:1417 length:588 start_codon:yes stop_codon:yes gene_type:complete